MAKRSDSSKSTTSSTITSAAHSLLGMGIQGNTSSSVAEEPTEAPATKAEFPTHDSKQLKALKAQRKELDRQIKVIEQHLSQNKPKVGDRVVLLSTKHEGKFARIAYSDEKRSTVKVIVEGTAYLTTVYPSDCRRVSE